MPENGKCANPVSQKIYCLVGTGRENNGTAVAILFYQYIGERDSDFLAAHNYSKEEALDGIKRLAERQGYGKTMEQRYGMVQDYIKDIQEQMSQLQNALALTWEKSAFYEKLQP